MTIDTDVLGWLTIGLGVAWILTLYNSRKYARDTLWIYEPYQKTKDQNEKLKDERSDLQDDLAQSLNP